MSRICLEVQSAFYRKAALVTCSKESMNQGSILSHYTQILFKKDPAPQRRSGPPSLPVSTSGPSPHAAQTLKGGLGRERLQSV